MAETRKIRPLRYGADTAHAWARHLDLENSMAKALLLAMSGYVNDRGEAFMGNYTLAKDTNMSVDTVRRRKAWLEEIGAIAIFACWEDENGNRNTEGRGRRTSDIVRFLMDADPDEIERKARAGKPPKVEVIDSDEAITPPLAASEGAPLATSEGLPQLALSWPSQYSEGLDSLNLESKASLPKPSLPPAASRNESAPNGLSDSTGQPLVPPGLQAVLAASMVTTTRLPQCISLWQGMTPGEQAIQEGGMRAYTQECREQNRRAMDPEKFLREHKAYAFANQGTAAGPASAAINTPEARAILVAHAIGNLPRPFLWWSGTSERLTLKVEVTAQIRALGACVNAHGDPDRSSWLEIEYGSPEAAAWSHFIVAVTGRWPVSRDLSGRRRGFYAPWRWPPRKDGSVGVAEEDVDALKELGQ